jgi:hypothetical protein
LCARESRMPARPARGRGRHEVSRRTALRRRYLRDDPTETIRSLREPKAEVDPLDPGGGGRLSDGMPDLTSSPPCAGATWTWRAGTLRIRLGRYRGQEGPPNS